MHTINCLSDFGIFKKEDMPRQGERKPNWKKERRRKQVFHRDLRECADMYPNFETDFGHLEGENYLFERITKALLSL